MKKNIFCFYLSAGQCCNQTGWGKSTHIRGRALQFLFLQIIPLSQRFPYVKSFRKLGTVHVPAVNFMKTYLHSSRKVAVSEPCQIIWQRSLESNIWHMELNFGLMYYYLLKTFILYFLLQRIQSGRRGRINIKLLPPSIRWNFPWQSNPNTGNWSLVQSHDMVGNRAFLEYEARILLSSIANIVLGKGWGLWKRNGKEEWNEQWVSFQLHGCALEKISSSRGKRLLVLPGSFLSLLCLASFSCFHWSQKRIWLTAPFLPPAFLWPWSGGWGGWNE